MSVFQVDRGQTGAEVDARTYNLTIGACVLYGLVVNYILVRYFAGFFLSIDPLLYLIVYFVCCLAGSVLCSRSEQFGMCFLGYNLIVLPVGGLVASVVPYYSISVVNAALLGTALVAGAALLLAAVRPQTFEGLGGTLGFMLLASLIVDLVLFLFGISSTFMDMLFVVIFAGYIGFDWVRANECYPSAVNAVRSASALYLDIINIFVRLLSILGKSRRRN